MLGPIKQLVEQFVGRMPLAQKVSLALISLIGLTLLTLWIIVHSHLAELIHRQTDVFGNAIVGQMANSAAESLLADDLLSLNVLVAQVTEASDIVSATITNIENQVLAQSGDTPFEFDADFIQQLPLNDPQLGVYISPINFQDVRAGYAYIVIDKHGIEIVLKRSLHWMTVATLMILFLSVLIAILLARNVTDPIKRLTIASRAIQRGEFDQTISNNRLDEIGHLVEGFNEMARGLQERDKMKDTFNRYFDPLVAKNILSNLDSPTLLSQYVNATVLFVDIVGFTKMCEHYEPAKVAEVLNTYYEVILRASEFYHGAVDKYIGDGAMILFGVPEVQEEHSFQAICCALVIIMLVEKMNAERENMGLPIIEFKLGLHSGEMLAGCLGCEDRLQYTVVGDTVNVASRLCMRGDPGKLVISQDAFVLARGDRRLLVSAGKIWDVKGRKEQIQVCEIEGLKDPFQDRLSSHVSQLYSYFDSDIQNNNDPAEKVVPDEVDS